MTKKLQIAFDVDSNVALRHVDPWKRYRNEDKIKRGEKPLFIVRDNFEFYADMQFDTFERSNSSVNFCALDDITEMKFSFFPNEMLDVIKRSVINNGRVSGIWTFVKRGSAQGVKLVRLDGYCDLCNSAHGLLTDYATNIDVLLADGKTKRTFKARVCDSCFNKNMKGRVDP